MNYVNREVTPSFRLETEKSGVKRGLFLEESCGSAWVKRAKKRKKDKALCGSCHTESLNQLLN